MRLGEEGAGLTLFDDLVEIRSDFGGHDEVIKRRIKG